MNRQHEYDVQVTWRDSSGSGTRTYTSYSRDHVIVAEGKPEIAASSDPSFRGDAHRYNPEELLLASLASCHMLWYLHLCAAKGINVLDYRDEAHGVMVEADDGGGAFSAVTLRPRVRIAAGGDTALALALHERAHGLCFIARSVNFPVHCEAQMAG
ncbi:MAG: OsmC family protein [Steroidobacteraceae bacterium]